MWLKNSKSDRDIILTAVTIDAHALQHASEALK